MTDPTAPNQTANHAIPLYPVRIWEVLLIGIGAIALVSTAMVGLGIKVLDNAFDPERATAIAQSLVHYTLPVKSQGVFGITIGGAKIAWVRSATLPPDIILFIGEMPVNKDTDADDDQTLDQAFEQPPSEAVAQNFVATASRTEAHTFCGQTVPVTIEQGQQTFAASPPLPAVRYTVSATENDIERVVILTASGKQAQANAIATFNSLQCR